MDLVIIALITAVSATAVGLAEPPDAVRVPLMLPLALFTPGYSLTSALYARRDDLNPLERLALSFGLSLAALPLIALALNYSPWGVRWEPLLAFVSLLVVLAAALGLLHRRLVPPQDRFAPSVQINLTGRVTLRGVLRTAATLALVAPLAALAVILLITLAGQRTGAAPHTEFYLLGSDGRVDSLPTALMVGEAAALTVGIANREGEEKLYSVTVSINGTPVQDIAGLRLGPGQRWQRPFVLAPERAGDRQLVQFDLQVDGVSGRAYRTLYIWVDVLEPLAPPPLEVLAQEQAPEPTPTPTPEPTPTPAPPQPIVHIVVRGENLTVISRLYEVLLAEVIAANPLPNPDLIFAEQEIVIPAADSAGEGE